jgi:hypothetical protein
MSNEEIREKILKFLYMRRQAGIPYENRVRYLPSMIGLTAEEFESNIEYLHQQRYVEANAALRLDGGMTYLHIKLLERGSTLTASQEHVREEKCESLNV